MEEPEQEVAVEGVELVSSSQRLQCPKAVAEVVAISVEEALLLNEVHEHQAVEHYGRVPLAVLLPGHAPDEVQEKVVLSLEPLVEPPCDSLDIERGPRPPRDVDDRDAGFLVKAENQSVELLDQRLTRLPFVVPVLAKRRRPSRLAPNPLPQLAVS